MRSRRHWLLIFTGFALMTLALMPPGNVSSDGASMLQVGASLAAGDGFSVPCAFGIPGRGGDCFSTYYPLQSILAVPFIATGHIIASVSAAPAEYLGGFAAQALPALAAAGSAGFTVYFAGLLGASRARSLASGLTVILATEIAIYFRSFFAATLSAMLICLIVWGFLRSDRWRLVAPVAIAGLILAKPQLVLVGLAVGGAFALTQHRLRPIVEAATATVIGAILYGAYNVLRFSELTNFGGETRTYDAAAFTPSKLAEAVGLLLVSPGRGLLVYSPIFVLGLYGAWRMRRHPLAVAAVAVLLATLLPYLGNPGSGSNWGSRYLAPTIPLFAALAWTVPVRRWIAPTLAVLGLIIAAPTFVAPYERSYAEAAVRGSDPSEVYWDISQAPIVDMWDAASHQISTARQTDVAKLARQPEPTPELAETVDAQKFFRVIAQWWWMTPAINVPRPVGVIIALIMMSTGLLALLVAGRRRHPGSPIRGDGDRKG